MKKLLVFILSLISYCVYASDSTKLGLHSGVKVYLEVNNYSHGKKNIYEFIEHRSGKWIIIKDTINKYGKRDTIVSNCNTCKTKLGKDFFKEIIRLSDFGSVLKPCIFFYNFKEEGGVPSFSTKDLWTEITYKVGFEVKGKKISVEQEDPYAAVEICPE